MSLPLQNSGWRSFQLDARVRSRENFKMRALGDDSFNLVYSSDVNYYHYGDVMLHYIFLLNYYFFDIVKIVIYIPEIFE